jgi:hypothetical protein
MPKISGKEIELGGEKYVMPPIPLAYMGRFQRAQTALAESDFENAAQDMIDVAHLTLLRNYPDLSVDVVSQNLDMGNMKQVIEALANISGFEKAGDTEGK